MQLEINAPEVEYLKLQVEALAKYLGLVVIHTTLGIKYELEPGRNFGEPK